MVTASYGLYGHSADRMGRIVFSWSHFLHPIQFHSFKEGPDLIVQNRPASVMDCLVRFWPNSSGPEASRCARIIPSCSLLAERNRPATSFPLSDSVALFHRRSGSIVQNSPDPIGFWSWTYMYMYRSMVLAVCVRFWPNRDPVRKQAGVQESSGPFLANASEPICHSGSGIFFTALGKDR